MTHSKDASSGTLDVDAASSTEHWAKSSEMRRMDWMQNMIVFATTARCVLRLDIQAAV